jgi:hypothetical protein
LNQSPIAKVLSLIHKKHLRVLVMGGQACVLYGSAEFSRDLDLALSLNSDDLRVLQEALDELQAECIAVPRFDPDMLRAGHSVHFRCHAPGAEGLRIDLMHSMRGVDSFETLWNRRTILTAEDDLTINLISVPDLVQAKKTQRDKDWPMIRRLVETHYQLHQHEASEEQRLFWLLQARTPGLLIELAQADPDFCRSLTERRPLLDDALQGIASGVESGLATEENRERASDRAYWEPLKRELERLRHQATR